MNQSAAHWRWNIADSDLFAYYGWCVSQGARPYLDIWDNKPPGTWWLNAAAVRLTGPGPTADVLLGSLAMGATLVAFVGIARRVFHRSLLLPAALAGAFLLTDLRFECGGNRTETFVVACETLAALGYLLWLRGRRYKWLVLAGLAAGAAPLFKQSGLAVTVAGALHLAWVQWRTPTDGGQGLTHPRGWKPWLVVGLAAAIAPGAAVITLAAQGALADAVFAVVTFNRAYFAIDDASWVRLDYAWRIYRPILAVWSPVFGLAALGLMAGLLMRWRRGQRFAFTGRPRRGVGLLVMWFVLAAYLAWVGPGRRGYHFVPALAPLVLLALYPLHLLVARRGLRTGVAGRAGKAVAIIVGSYLLITVAAGGLGEAARCWATKPHWYALRRQSPAPYEVLAAEIAQRTDAADRIYVWGWNPSVYRYALRLPASRHATLEKVGHVGAHAAFIQERVAADLQRDPPKSIVISSYDRERLDPALASWLAARYERACTAADMDVFLRRAGWPQTGGATENSSQPAERLDKAPPRG